MPAPTRITACLNGGRPAGSHPRLPLTAAQLVADAVSVVSAGAAALHLHVRDVDGPETLDPAAVDETVRAVQRACPDVPVGVGTGPDSVGQAELIRRWTAPDAAAVALYRPGHYAAMGAVLDAGIRLQVGVSEPADVQRLLRTGMVDEIDRVLVRPGFGDAAMVDRLALIRAIERALDAAAVHAPRLHYGVDAGTWEVLRGAVVMGRDIRIGLEDTFVGTDGRPAASNAALVRMARKIAEA